MAEKATRHAIESDVQSGGSPVTMQRIGIVAGPALFLLIYLFVRPESMPPAAVSVLASTVWMATWWITEAMPIPVTSLLPLVLFPVLGISSMKDAAAPYSDPTVYLFLGGFLVALAVERWNLHRRIALSVINVLGTSPSRLVLGFMASTAVLSMWLSNTATAMMMMPIGLAVIKQLESLRRAKHPHLAENVVDIHEVPKSNFGTALMLAIAYGASIGGVGTLIGTPPNAVLAGVAGKMGLEISFAKWMILAVPLVLLFMLITWFVLVKVFPSEAGEIPGGKQLIRSELQSMGKLTKEERWALTVFVIVSFLWITRPWVVAPYFPKVDDASIAIFGGLLLFMIPSNFQKNQFMLTAEAIGKVPWGILLLFGAGFSLAGAFGTSGLSKWLGESLTGLQGVGLFGVLAAVVTLTIFLTEVTSNTAIATLLMPIMGSLGAALNVAPLGLMIAAALAASFAFMLPVATPPNAIVFGSGYVSIKQMAKAGLWLNLIGIVLITLFSYFVAPIIFGL